MRSLEIENIIKSQINAPVLNHPNTSADRSVLMGYDFATVREQIVGCGLADFTKGYDKGPYPLSVQATTLLYCYTNMKNHLDAAIQILKLIRQPIQSLQQPNEPFYVIDVGCGPATMMLALANEWPTIDCQYIGIDRAPAMLEKAQSLWKAAQSKAIISKTSTAQYATHWSAIDVAQLPPKANVLLACSYFFGSTSLDVTVRQSLLAFVKSLLDSPRTARVSLYYANSRHANAVNNYRAFKEELGLVSLMEYLDNNTEYEVVTMKG